MIFLGLLLTLFGGINADAFGQTLPLSIHTSLHRPIREWTLLIYMNGNNDLDEYGPKDLNELETVGSNDEVNLVVQWASLDAQTTRRLLVKKDLDPEIVTTPILEDLGQIDMGDYTNFIEFVRWGAQNFPAKHYMVVIWNHGSGWTRKPMRDISWDDNTGNAITTEQLSLALEKIKMSLGQKVDILGMDACNMAMIEIGRQVSDFAKILVASEESEPAEGWPYGEWLGRWVGKRKTSTQEMTKMLVESFVSSYEGGSQGTEEVTLSALELDEVDDLEKRLANLSLAIRAAPDTVKQSLLDAATSSLRFDIPDNVDLGDLADHFLTSLHFLNSKTKDHSIRDLQAATLEVKSALQDVVIASQTTPKYSLAQGVALWFPVEAENYDKDSTRYKKLTFDLETNWSAAIESLLATKR